MTTRNNPVGDESMAAFLDSVCEDSRLRVERDLGQGFVRLRTTEAEKRQAAQDIRSSESIVIELLRNARDAGAKNVFLATQKERGKRIIVCIDDGRGIPPAMHAAVFEPRVTSKLDTCHMDRWGLHGRGMALYSVTVNADAAAVAFSDRNRGASIRVVADTRSLGEKADQSSFPRIELSDGSLSLRGPRNILRTAAEFALDSADALSVYCGTATEIAATMYRRGLASIPPASRAFAAAGEAAATELLAYAADPEDLAARAARIGLEVSERSARRMIDGQIAPLRPLLESLKAQIPAFEASSSTSDAPQPPGAKAKARRSRIPIAEDDRDEFARAVGAAFGELAAKYFLASDVDVSLTVGAGAIHIDIPLEKLQ